MSWCDRLGLDDSGSRKDLQARLADHYKVKLPLEAIKGQRVISVKSARESQYYTLPEVNEKYVVLRGGVDIEIRDQTHGSVEEVKADNVTYNQTRHTMSAQGDVSYTITKGQETQNYTGKSFSFDLDSSEGVFYDGTTTKDTTQGDTKLTYTFAGTTISRLSNNTVILKDGSFTTSQPVDPFWRIRASDVWILAPSEWAIDNAVLMVGRVPLLYIPAFFWPGDELFFHPNPGYDNRLGVYVQTTTYLLGRKTTADNPFSFLQISDTGAPAYREELRGLFLRKIPGESPPPDKGTLKFLLDGYSRLGVFTGLNGDFPPVASFRLGLGFSRSLFLYTDPTGAQYYTPYYSQSGLMYWNTSSILGALLPFRFGMDGSIQNSSDVYSLSWKFAYYSDPTFISDFYNRSEGLNFQALLQPTTLNPVQTAATATQPNLSWDYVSKLDLTKSLKSPFIQSISFPTLNLNVTWQSKDVPGATADPLYSDPGHTFYYPSSITFPNISFAVSGELLKLGNSNGVTPQAGAGTSTSTTPSTGAAAAPSTNGATPSPAAPASTVGAAPTPPASQSGASAGLPGGQAQQGAAAQPGTAAQPGAQSQPGAQGQNAQAAAPEVKDPGKGLRSPLAEKPQTEEQKQGARSLYREPDLWPDANAEGAGLGSTLDITYQVQPRATLQHTFDSTNWTTPQNIDYGILYQTLDTGGFGPAHDRCLPLGQAHGRFDGLQHRRRVPAAVQSGPERVEQHHPTLAEPPAERPVPGQVHAHGDVPDHSAPPPHRAPFFRFHPVLPARVEDVPAQLHGGHANPYSAGAIHPGRPLRQLPAILDLVPVRPLHQQPQPDHAGPSALLPVHGPGTGGDAQRLGEGPGTGVVADNRHSAAFRVDEHPGPLRFQRRALRGISVRSNCLHGPDGNDPGQGVVAHRVLRGPADERVAHPLDAEPRPQHGKQPAVVLEGQDQGGRLRAVLLQRQPADAHGQ